MVPYFDSSINMGAIFTIRFYKILLKGFNNQKFIFMYPLNIVNQRVLKVSSSSNELSL